MNKKPRVRYFRPVEIDPDPESSSRRFLIEDGAQLSNEQACVALAGLFLLELADGTRSIPEIVKQAKDRASLVVTESQVEDLLASMDRLFLLDNERSRQALAARNPRPPRHAGSGYPTEQRQLEAFLDELLQKPDEPSDAWWPPASILPHIDFYRGRSAYQAGYRHLHGLPSKGELTVVILGISHAQCDTPFILTSKDFQTPLGVVETDISIVNQLSQDLPFDPFADEFNHMAEHSIEFHAVLLKRLVKDQARLKIVPILCRSFHQAEVGGFSPLELPGVSAFLKNLTTLRDSHPNCHFLASVDLAHVGRNFGGPTLTLPFLQQLESRDRESLAGVETGNAQQFFATHQKDKGDRNYCGTPAIFSLLHLFPKPFTLHSYHQCTDADLGSSVTICSASIPPAEFILSSSSPDDQRD